ncbi:MAG TPA: sodium:alanine symporter family protein [Thermoanaerobaculia bacterium]|nr:sodium:alanine symporter family protein [Thermoanaerobaculia bacterium]
MNWFEWIVGRLEYFVWSWGIPVGGEQIPFLVIALLGTGIFLTLRLGFIQIRRLGHGFAVTSGKYDDPEEPGDVAHFQALTTALSATVGIGNIAGVAIAIHFGGPGALFWMWVTALLGMAVKYTEVTLAQHFRDVGPDADPKAWEGSVSGGPMYYIERGLGKGWKPVAAFFALALMATSFLTGNAVQANTVADTMLDEFAIPVWATGLTTAVIVALVILGGIRRIGKVTAVLAPVMAAVYVLGALAILIGNAGAILPTFVLIFEEAFNPSAGIAGTGVGAFLATMMWGVRRGLFSNEAGQGSAPIAHAAAKTDEPVSEGVVALLEPFIDTLVICTMTGLAILVTGVWSERVPTALELSGGDISFVEQSADGAFASVGAPESIEFRGGVPLAAGEGPAGGPKVAWHEVAVDELFVDAGLQVPFTGTFHPGRGVAVAADGQEYRQLYGMAVESGAPLTKLAFQRGLGDWGGYIVIFSVLLFAISTAISWSYYGDRCANYLWGPKAILPFKVVFVIMHFVGAMVSLAVVWTIGDIALGFVTFPNLIALIALSGLVAKMTKSYFQRRAWEPNAEAHKRWSDHERERKARERAERAERKKKRPPIE